jgi:hypothetical protein
MKEERRECNCSERVAHPNTVPTLTYSTLHGPQPDRLTELLLFLSSLLGNFGGTVQVHLDDLGAKPWLFAQIVQAAIYHGASLELGQPFKKGTDNRQF